MQNNNPSEKTWMPEPATGWNTWNTRSVLSHVCMPEGLAINLAIKNHQTGHVIRESLIGRFGEREEHIHPGPRGYDGRYTELNWKQDGLEILFRSMVLEEVLYLAIIPVNQPIRPPTLIVEAQMLWQSEGTVLAGTGNGSQAGTLIARLPDRTVTVSTDGESVRELNTGATGPALTLRLDRTITVTTGTPMAAPQILALMDSAKSALLLENDKYGELGELYGAMRTCLAWDTIHEPEKDQVCSPVSRLWNLNWGGYVLFCWDTFFAALMANLDNPSLARANASAILAECTESGFVPNFGAANDFKSRDRSQPPVGSYAVREIYRRHGDRGFVEAMFEPLLVWNRWWVGHRMTAEGTLCWGSDPFQAKSGAFWELNCVDDTAGAALESGLDNSPMYDDMPYNKDTHTMALADVGLTGLYVFDCECLADLAVLLGRPEHEELRRRAEHVKTGLETLWDDDFGMYCNRRTDTGVFSHRLSPTLFYALFSGRVSQERADRMLNEHFYNPEEFWGEFVLPSIARNDPAYGDQDYWRGRIWAPLNYLTYLALRRHGCRKAATDLAHKSAALFLKEWRAHGHVHENYNGDTGWGCDAKNSDKFYHWGALLALTALTEAGHAASPDEEFSCTGC